MPLPTTYYKTGFAVDQLPDLTGKVAIVTGGNTGLGFETVVALANKGARVFMASRSEERARQAIERIKADTGKDVEFLRLDLQDINQAKAAADEFLAKKLPLNILVNNAGIMACPFGLTKDGIESQIGTNHLGHFVFATTLMPALEKGAPSRVVSVSSYGHTFCPAGGIQFDKINEPNAHNAWTRYGQSKLANILFARGLDKRFGSKGIFANSLHPGVVYTELTRGPKDLYGFTGLFSFMGSIMSFGEWLISLSPKDGALTQIFLAASNDVVDKNIRAKYFVPFAKETDDVSKYAVDDELADRLWEWSEKTVAEKLRK
ncbi:hypothetical protein HK105_201937 [Polyrhizophydium stewartii]|uniref:NAD(P)-binding protein n=1 Tax=Polyrhizophydium stewartii TaxID=2732419 RepID=A0ABR4NGB1_9FUNG